MVPIVRASCHCIVLAKLQSLGAPLVLPPTAAVTAQLSLPSPRIHPVSPGIFQFSPVLPICVAQVQPSLAMIDCHLPTSLSPRGALERASPPCTLRCSAAGQATSFGSAPRTTLVPFRTSNPKLVKRAELVLSNSIPEAALGACSPSVSTASPPWCLPSLHGACVPSTAHRIPAIFPSF